MTFNEIYSAIKKDNIQARKDKNTWAVNVTNDLRVRFADAEKYDNVSDLNAIEIVKKVKREYEEAKESKKVKLNPDIWDDNDSLAIAYCKEFLPKEIKHPAEVREYVKQAFENASLTIVKMSCMGRIVKDVKELTKGMADGKMIADEVRKFIQTYPEGMK